MKADSSHPDPSFDPDHDQGWGPLAVARDEGRLHALASGTLLITETCTYLLDQTGEVAYLLVWRAADTRWDAQRGRIVFRNPDYREPPSEIFVLEDGQPVRLGGGDAPFVAPIDASDANWAAVPHADCMAPAFWYVGEIAR